jgi:hypothetical protein
MVIKSTIFKETTGYRLREGDVIKLGKVMFKVKELKSDEKQSSRSNKLLNKDKTISEYPANNNLNSNNIEMDIIHNEVKKKKMKMKKVQLPCCRICLMDDNEAENPLINACLCIGSVRFIHLLCLRQWLKSKITSKLFNFLTVHSFKNTFECELCKAPLPGKIII